MKLGLIGKAIMNSSSPDLHVRLGQLTGIPTTYDLFDANEQPIKSLAKQVDKVIAAGYRGVNGLPSIHGRKNGRRCQYIGV